LRIDLNGMTFTIVTRSLAEMLTELGVDGAAIATAVNGTFVLAPMQGG
jgi:sulfur carrier protein ThiS